MSADPLELRTDQGPVRLRYISEPPWVYILATDRASSWPASVLRSGRASVRIDGKAWDGPATLVTAPGEWNRLVARFREDVGSENAARWFSHPGRLLGIRLDASSAPADPYGQWLEAEFDAVAPEYSDRVEQNPVEVRYRHRSLAVLRRTFPRPGRLLELGSGTGVETLPMLRAGHEVSAVDVSESMLASLQRNADRAGVGGRLRTARIRARDVGSLMREFGPASFDGAFSTFGTLNLEPDLRPVVIGLAELLRPGAALVAGSYNRTPLLASGAALAQGRPGPLRIVGRQPAPVGTHRFPVDVYLRGPQAIRRAFAPEFLVRSTEGVGVLLPPPDLAPRFERWGVDWDRLDRWDARVGAWRWLASFGDLTLSVLERAEADGPVVPPSSDR